MVDGCTVKHWHTLCPIASSLRLLPGVSTQKVFSLHPAEDGFTSAILNNGLFEDGTAVILLNGDHSDCDVDLLASVWVQASLKVAVDGGANYLSKSVDMTHEGMLPDMVTGDFDSASASVLSFLRSKYTSVINTPDQDETDFMKCMRIIIDEIRKRNLQIARILVFGAYGLRLDHIFANVNVLVVASSLTSIPIYLVDGHQQSCLLLQGSHMIHVGDLSQIDWCALVPITGPAYVSTSGLRWELKESLLSFGSLVSTSNSPVSSQVTVNTSAPLLWIIGDKRPK